MRPSVLRLRYFLRKLRRVKKANGQVLAINEGPLPWPTCPSFPLCALRLLLLPHFCLCSVCHAAPTTQGLVIEHGRCTPRPSPPAVRPCGRNDARAERKEELSSGTSRRFLALRDVNAAGS